MIMMAFMEILLLIDGLEDNDIDDVGFDDESIDD